MDKFIRVRKDINEMIDLGENTRLLAIKESKSRLNLSLQSYKEIFNATINDEIYKCEKEKNFLRSPVFISETVSNALQGLLKSRGVKTRGDKLRELLSDIEKVFPGTGGKKGMDRIPIPFHNTFLKMEDILKADIKKWHSGEDGSVIGCSAFCDLLEMHGYLDRNTRGIKKLFALERYGVDITSARGKEKFDKREATRNKYRTRLREYIK